MALCLAASLIERKGFDPLDQLGRYTAWYREGYMSSTGSCFDIENTVRRALDRFARTGKSYCGSVDSLGGSASRPWPTTSTKATGDREAPAA